MKMRTLILFFLISFGMGAAAARTYDRHLLIEAADALETLESDFRSLSNSVAGVEPTPAPLAPRDDLSL